MATLLTGNEINRLTAPQHRAALNGNVPGTLLHGWEIGVRPSMIPPSAAFDALPPVALASFNTLAVPKNGVLRLVAYEHPEGESTLAGACAYRVGSMYFGRVTELADPNINLHRGFAIRDNLLRGGFAPENLKNDGYWFGAYFP